MGIDYDGGMIVGALGDELDVPEDYDGDLYDWMEENDMDSMSQWYDCDTEDCYFGYTVPDIPVDEIEGEWLADVKAKAEKFEALTGVTAQLIGTLDVT